MLPVTTICKPTDKPTNTDRISHADISATGAYAKTDEIREKVKHQI